MSWPNTADLQLSFWRKSVPKKSSRNVVKNLPQFLMRWKSFSHTWRHSIESEKYLLTFHLQEDSITTQESFFRLCWLTRLKNLDQFLEVEDTTTWLVCSVPTRFLRLVVQSVSKGFLISLRKSTQQKSSRMLVKSSSLPSEKSPWKQSWTSFRNFGHWISKLRYI